MTEAGDKLLHNGNTIRDEDIYELPIHVEGMEEERFRVYDSKGVFYGIYDYEEKRRVYKPFKMFIP